MSYPIFSSAVPFVRDPGWKKTPHFNTVTNKPSAVRGVVTASLVPYPTWDFDVSISHAKGDEINAASVMAAFFDIYIQCLGSGAFFLITDPNDYTVTQANSTMLNVTPDATNPMSNTGDGVSTQFQLARTIGPSGLAFDIIQNVNGSPSGVFVNGSTASYTISDLGVVTFGTAPPNNAVLQWAGAFYFLCQFSDDSLADLARVGFIPDTTGPNGFDGLWSCGSIKFSSIFI